jgi:phosphoribosylanthranilate isomerase
MKVKICGITNLEDAMVAVEAGADALGFVFYPPSPRHLSPEKAKEIISQLPPFVSKVALFVKTPAEEVVELCRYIGADTAQLHWEVPEEVVREVREGGIYPLPVVRAKSPGDLEEWGHLYRIVDNFVEEYGGMGKRLPIEWFKGRDNSQTILAGGLTPDNLSQLKGLGFYGVDVSSGVEKAPGLKDPELVRRFVEVAKSL